MNRQSRKSERKTRRVDGKLRLLSGNDLPGRDRDAEPPRMLQPGTRGEVTTLRGDLTADLASSAGGTLPLLPDDSAPRSARSRSVPWASYGVQHCGTARPLRVQHGPVSMLSRRHDRPLLRDRRQEQVFRNRLLFFLLLCAIAALLVYSFR